MDKNKTIQTQEKQVLPETIALQFNNCINNQNLVGLVDLMTGILCLFGRQT